MPSKLTEGMDEETKPKGTVPQDPKPEDQPQDRLITSQNDTTPKRVVKSVRIRCCLITSQNDTTPKLLFLYVQQLLSLTTSQNDTTPKRRRKQMVQLKV